MRCVSYAQSHLASLDNPSSVGADTFPRKGGRAH
jgi:hypothetical protein